MIPFRALKTPQLLELSGIGRKDVLEKIAIPMKIELPGVGENIQEHIFIPLSWGTPFHHQGLVRRTDPRELHRAEG